MSVACLAIGAASTALPALAQQAGGEAANEEVKETIGDWSVVCQTVQEQELCFLEQVVLNNDGEAMVRMRVRKLPQPQVVGAQTILAEAQFLVPLNTFLPAEMGLRIDENQTLRTPYTRCVAIGCFAQPPLSETLVRQLKNGAKAAVIMAIAPGQPSLNASMSLNGFTAAFDKL
ncbi:MAG: invasion associated locus B family protein [Pseudomonadota bacterium]